MENLQKFKMFTKTKNNDD